MEINNQYIYSGMIIYDRYNLQFGNSKSLATEALFYEITNDCVDEQIDDSSLFKPVTGTPDCIVQTKKIGLKNINEE